jgi:hypothetical protein
MATKINTHHDLEVYQKAFDAAMKIFEISKAFPQDEKYSLTDQMRRSSRSVCSNLAEAWRKRRYEGAFSANFQMPKVRPPRLRFGWNSPSNANT